MTTVKDLIKMLQQYPEDMLVLVEAHESGANPANAIEEVFVSEQCHDKDEWWLGEYYIHHTRSNTAVSAVLITYERRK